MGIIRLIMGAVLLAGCGTYHEDYGNSKNSSLDKSQFKTLSFAAVTAYVFQDRCVECHSGPKAKKGVDLTTYGGTLSNIGAIQSDVSSDHMPFNQAPLSAHQKQILFAWIAAKAPETSDIPMPGIDEPPPPPPPEPPPGFGTINTKIFQPYCSRCHESVFSELVKVRKNIREIQMEVELDKMPKDSRPLKPELKDLLNNWILAKMPEGFTEVQRKLFVPYCVRCHQNLNDYDKVAKNIGDIQEQIAKGDMPKEGPELPEKVKTLLEEWVKSGMPK